MYFLLFFFYRFNKIWSIYLIIKVLWRSHIFILSYQKSDKNNSYWFYIAKISCHKLQIGRKIWDPKKKKRKNVDQFSISLLLLFIQVVAKCCWWVEWMDGGTMLANSHSWNFQNPSLWTFFLCEVTELTPAHPHVRAFHYEFFSFLILVLCFLFSIDPCPTQISH